MSDKTELLAVPRELLERLAGLKPDYTCAMIDADEQALREILATPAEDVRAVVEEPAAWMQFDGEGNNYFTDDHETAERWAKNNGPKYADWLTPLYRHPQRPVMLPEKFTRRTSDDRDEAYDSGWNACLDAVEELSK